MMTSQFNLHEYLYIITILVEYTMRVYTCTCIVYSLCRTYMSYTGLCSIIYIVIHIVCILLSI